MTSEYGLFPISGIWTSNWISDYESYQKINLNKLVIKIALKWAHSPKITATVKPCRMWIKPSQRIKHHYEKVKMLYCEVWGW